jgi:uncharacterized DUF497 family protein
MGEEMLFHWDEENRAHIARHDVAPIQAEAAFLAIDSNIHQDNERLNRWTIEATVDRRTIKVVFARVFPEGYRVVTAHWMSSKRRRKS